MSLPVVLIPGLNCSARIYGEVIPALWRFGPVMVADHTRGDSVQAIAGYILGAAPPRFALAGFSLGGYIAFEMLRRAPDRILRLAALDTSARPETPAQTALRAQRAELTRAGRFEEAVEAQMPLLFHPSRSGDEALQQRCRVMARECGPDVFLRHIGAIMRRPDSRPDLAAVRCPTLVLVGDSDEITPRLHSEEMAEAIPGARLVVVPECGHMSLIERPEVVARAMRDWLHD